MNPELQQILSRLIADQYKADKRKPEERASDMTLLRTLVGAQAVSSDPNTRNIGELLQQSESLLMDSQRIRGQIMMMVDRVMLENERLRMELNNLLNEKYQKEREYQQAIAEMAK